MVYKLSPDILNIAVWSWKEGRAKVSTTKKIILTILSILAIGAQIQACFVIIKNFILRVDKTGLQHLLHWDIGLYISAIVCFCLTSYQTFDDGKQRIINMTNTRNVIMWLLNYTAYVANFSVATAVFFTILQQTTVNDLWTNYAGLLILIQIDNLIGDWACEYLVDIDQEEEEATFLVMKDVTDLEIGFSEKIICLLMLIFTVWTSIVYKGLAQYDPKYTESKIYEYLTYTYVGFFLWPLLQLFMKVFCHCCFCCKCCKSPVDEDNIEVDVAGGDNYVIHLKERILDDDDKGMLKELEANDATIKTLQEKVAMLQELIAKREG